MKRFLSALEKHFYFLEFRRREQHSFLEDWLLLVESGVPAHQAIETIREVSDGSYKQVASDIAHAIGQGRLFSDGMQGWFSGAAVEIVRAGEAGGNFSGALSTSIETYRQQMSIIDVLLNSFLYPLLVLVLALIMTVVIKNSVFNNFSQIKSIDQWPSIGIFLYGFANMITAWWWLVMVLLVLTIIGLSYLLQNGVGFWRHSLDEWPIFTLYRRTVAARFMEMLGLLTANGVVLKKALRVLQKGANPYLSWHLFLMEFRLSAGKDNIADVLDTKLLSHQDIVRLRVIAKGKGFEGALVSLGRQAQKRNVSAIQVASKIGGGIVLVMGACIAASLVFGIYSVGSSIAN